MVHPVILSGVKAVGRETLRTGCRILTDITNNTSADVKPVDIVAKGVGESAQNLIQKPRGRGRKQPTPKRGENSLRRRRRRSSIQKEISSHKTYQSMSDYVCGNRFSKFRVRHFCYQTRTYVDSRDDPDGLQTHSFR